MAGVNKVILVGNFGKDPEYKNINNADFVSFSLATSETWKDKDGKKQERTEWHNVVAWRGLAKTIADWCGKGSTVYLEGKLQTRNWEKDGVKHYTTEIIADTLTMLGGNKQNNGRNEANTQPAANTTTGSRTQVGYGENAHYYNNNDPDNDLPF